MERYYKRKLTSELISPLSTEKVRETHEQHSSKRTCVELDSTISPLNAEKVRETHEQHNSKRTYLKLDLTNPLADPGLRKPIANYHPNDKEVVQRAHLQRGPCQPREHVFLQVMQGEYLRRFNPKWFNDHPTWLEYSVENDAAYCLCCYLFRPESREHAGSCHAFVIEGFTNWKRKEKIDLHVRGPNSAHNQAWNKCQALMNQDQHIETILTKQTEQDRINYRVHLNASVNSVWFLLRQGFAFRGHDESSDSFNQGNFLETLKFLVDNNEDIRRVSLDKSPGNLKLVTSDIQKDIVRACAIETTNLIIKDLGDAMFSILVDEACDISIKEQMAVVLRYVDNHGHVVECLLGVTHVVDTTALSLKATIEALFAKHKLSLSRIRGQGYDGACNMCGEFNDLKALILKENECAFYVHCFAHQLQLSLVAVAKKNMCISSLFTVVSNVVNVVGGSCKRHDILHEHQVIKVMEALEKWEISSGQGLNQETTLKRVGNTRWSSHNNTLISLITMFSSVIDVFDIVVKDLKLSSDQRFEAHSLLESLQRFDFTFS